MILSTINQLNTTTMPRFNRIKENNDSVISGRTLDAMIDGSRITKPSAIEIDASTTIGSNFKEEILKYITKQFSHAPLVKHECHSCGATLEIDNKKHVFVCPYCGSVYAIGTKMVNDRREY